MALIAQRIQHLPSGIYALSLLVHADLHDKTLRHPLERVVLPESPSNPQPLLVSRALGQLSCPFHPTTIPRPHDLGSTVLLGQNGHREQLSEV